MRTGDLARAAAELDRAVAIEPQGLWPNFARGRCAARRGDHAEAVLAFSVCAALAPADANVFYHRALELVALGRTSAALHDLDRTLDLNAAYAPAAQQRELILERIGGAVLNRFP